MSSKISGGVQIGDTPRSVVCRAVLARVPGSKITVYGLMLTGLGGAATQQPTLRHPLSNSKRRQILSRKVLPRRFLTPQHAAVTDALSTHDRVHAMLVNQPVKSVWHILPPLSNMRPRKPQTHSIFHGGTSAFCYQLTRSLHHHSCRYTV